MWGWRGGQGVGSPSTTSHRPHCCPQVFDRDKTLKSGLYLATPISCCCYLNDDGDILLGLGNRLVVVKASKYEHMRSQGAYHCLGHGLLWRSLH